MMFHVNSILAAGDDEIGKIVIGVIVFAFWAIGSLASWVKKQQAEEQRRRGEWQRAIGSPPAAPAPRVPPVQISEGLATRFPEVLRPPQPAPPPRLSMPQQLTPQQRRVQNAQRARRPIPVPPPPPVSQRFGRRGVLEIQQTMQGARVAGAESPVASRTAAIPAPAVAPKRPNVSANAPAVAKWLRPETLRQQFILTDILQPPVALRDQHLS